ncbi:unnamed protein product [Closterium sp. Yama58-4]|nr:unnamed protein product [Closterium sp. Yama58-4]
MLVPVGMIWGGTANRGRLKLRQGNVRENWTSGVDLHRLLTLLDLEMVTTDEELQEYASAQAQAAKARRDASRTSSDQGKMP